MNETSRRVVRIHAYGGPEALTVDQGVLTMPAANECLVAVEAAGVNFYDTQLRSGAVRRKPLPVEIGLEGAGHVLQAGSAVSRFKAGDAVAWVNVPGSCASHVTVHASSLVPRPTGISADSAAAALYQGMTAHYLAHDVFALAKGHACLVHSAAGGVGQMLCQIARLRGATVFATVSTREKIEPTLRAGATHTFLYDEPQLAEKIRALSDGGVHVVFDAVGQATFELSLAVLRPRGVFASYGEASGSVNEPNLLERLRPRSLSITRTGLNHFVADEAEYQRRAGDILNWLADGSLRVDICASLPLAEVAHAHCLIESRGTVGKIILQP